MIFHPLVAIRLLRTVQSLKVAGSFGRRVVQEAPWSVPNYFRAGAIFRRKKIKFAVKFYQSNYFVFSIAFSAKYYACLIEANKISAKMWQKFHSHS